MNTFSILWCYPDKSLVLPIFWDTYIVLRIRVYGLWWSFRPLRSALFAPFSPIFSVPELRCKITAFYPCGQYHNLLKFRLPRLPWNGELYGCECCQWWDYCLFRPWYCIIRISNVFSHKRLAYLKYIVYLCNRNRPAAEWGAAVALNK